MEAEGLYMRIMKRFKISFLLVLFIITVGRQPVAAEPLRPYLPESILRAHGVALTQHAVVAALRNKDIEVRRAASNVLTRHWPRMAVSVIQQALSSEQEPFTRLFMAADLARIDDPLGRKTLISECHNDSAWGSVRMYAATVLSRDFGDDSCLDPVLDVLQSEADPKEGEGAKEMALELVPVLIGRVDKSQSQRLFELLTSALRDPHPYLRMTASATLRSLGDVRAIPSLQAAIANETDEGCLLWMNVSLKELQSKRQAQ
jgi:hypothetical protein